MKSLNDKTRFIVGIIYVFFFIYLLFFAPFRHNTLTEVNLIPFKTTAEQLSPFFNSNDTVSVEYFLYICLMIFGNLLFLLPIPILFQLDWKGTKKWAAIILLPIIIELIQYFFQVGSADIDDIIFNSTGFALGFWLRKKRF
ncbi:VanZ family protein [Paracrocinitomix mangrovi]|uniref:VanZ family protein n=1 Tax=Paracrocinitomix mangrovi TaxID=2862509 RepID=UPI001C8DF259|nr:VanZ family protein [Paracrocinitomix mangrovi]UKN00513.1 VanZ family protein [Paracrocinitomix mangrovi]